MSDHICPEKWEPESVLFTVEATNTANEQEKKNKFRELLHCIQNISGGRRRGVGGLTRQSSEAHLQLISQRIVKTLTQYIYYLVSEPE